MNNDEIFASAFPNPDSPGDFAYDVLIHDPENPNLNETRIVVGGFATDDTDGTGFGALRLCPEWDWVDCEPPPPGPSDGGVGGSWALLVAAPAIGSMLAADGTKSAPMVFPTANSVEQRPSPPAPDEILEIAGIPVGNSWSAVPRSQVTTDALFGMVSLELPLAITWHVV